MENDGGVQKFLFFLLGTLQDVCRALSIGRKSEPLDVIAFGIVQKREDFGREDNEGYTDRLLKRMHDGVSPAQIVASASEQGKEIASDE
jgi:hypothetical protein